MLTLFFANALGWFVAHKRLMLYIIGGAALLLLVVFAYRGCKSKPDIKIDEADIQRINSKNEAERNAALKVIIEKNLETVSTVDERNTLANTNNVEMESEIKAKLEQSKEKADAVREQDGDVTEDELKCILNKDACANN